MPVLGVLFDLGGTLIDTSDPLRWATIASELGLVVDADHLAHRAREVESELDRAGSLPSEGARWARVLSDTVGRPVPESVGTEFLERWRRSEFRPPLFSDARYCLEQFQAEGTAMGVVSNAQSAARVSEHLTRTGIARFFSVVVASGTEGVEKPDPRIFLRAIDRLRLRPRDAVHVGDLAVTDARGATSAGLHGVWLNRYGWGFGDDPPEITSLAELPGYVRRLPDPRPG